MNAFRIIFILFLTCVDISSIQGALQAPPAQKRPWKFFDICGPDWFGPRCMKDFCEVTCTKTSCMAACCANMCHVNCTGSQCTAACQGTNCASTCHGHECVSYARFAGTIATCFGASCQAHCELREHERDVLVRHKGTCYADCEGIACEQHSEQKSWVWTRLRSLNYNYGATNVTKYRQITENATGITQNHNHGDNTEIAQFVKPVESKKLFRPQKKYNGESFAKRDVNLSKDSEDKSGNKYTSNVHDNKTPKKLFTKHRD